MADTVKDAQELYTEALEASADQRKQIQEDLDFSDPSNPKQWDEDVRNKRETDPGGRRFCLVFDQTGQYIANVAGQVEQRPPALHAIPVDSGADKKVAESLDGFFRHVEHTSRAQQHYATALTSAARSGVGYLLVKPEYVDRAMGYQEPRISSEGDPLRVVFDPWSKETDGSDATFAYHLTPFSKREFLRNWPKSDPKSFGEGENKKVDERDSINVVTEWKIEDKTEKMVFCIDLTTQNQEVFALPEDEFFQKQQKGEVQAAQDSAGRQTYDDKYRCVKWARMSGAEVLTDSREYPASGIGIVPIYGYVGWSNGRLSYCGIPRRARAPQQSYNYHMSELQAYMASAPKSPWMVPLEGIQDEGVKALWDKAGSENRAWIPYRAYDDDGKPVPPPSRTPVSVNLANHIQGAQQAKEDIQASLGMYYASLGAPSNETSGVAIDSRKQQGEAATAHFPSHLAAGLGQVGKLVMEMIPKLIDTKRQVRVLSIDNTPGMAVVDPEQSQAVQEQDGAPISINPNVGKYDVRVVVGPSFTTQRQETHEALTEMLRGSPDSAPIILPFWAQTLDAKGMDKMAQAFAATAPPEVRAIIQPDSQQSTEQLKAENEKLKQGLQEAIQHAHDADDEAQQAKDELQKVQADTEAKKQEVAIKDRESQVKIATTLDEQKIRHRELQLEEAKVALTAKQHLDNKEQTDKQMERDDAKEEANKSDPEQDDQMEEALTKVVEQVVQEQTKTSKAIDSLMQAQQQNQELMKTLIKAVQAPRIKEIKYDKNGDPIGSTERIETLQ